MAEGSAGRDGESRVRTVEVVLRLAFAEEPEAPAGEIGEEVASAAETLGLAERIADRHPDRVPERLKDRLRREASRGMLLEATLERMAEAAEAVGAEVILLKGMALIRAGITAPGRRPCVDVDVLASPEAAERLTDRLLDEGFVPYEVPEGDYHHHGAPLLHPELGAVEIHTRLPGVRLTGAEATADAVRDTGPDDPAPRRGVPIPPPPILAAHAIAHCLYQERFLGQGIGFFRTMGDLVDLERSGALDDAVEAARPFLAGSLPSQELDALAALIRSLRAGDPPEEPAARRMLEHFVSACYDPAETRRRLRWKRLFHVLGMPGGFAKLMARLLAGRDKGRKGEKAERRRKGEKAKGRKGQKGRGEGQ